MKKYLAVLSVEFILSFFWFWYTQLFFLYHFILYSYMFVFPVIYIILTIIDIKNSKSFKFYFLGLTPVLFTTIITFIADGTTTAESNPDSSIFLWFLFFNFLRFMALLTGFIVVLVLKYIFFKADKAKVNK